MNRPWAVGVSVVYAYEVTALTTGVVPSISACCWSLRYTHRGRAVLAVALGLFLWHLLGTGPGAMPKDWLERRVAGRRLGVPLRT